MRLEELFDNKDLRRMPTWISLKAHSDLSEDTLSIPPIRPRGTQHSYCRDRLLQTVGSDFAEGFSRAATSSSGRIDLGLTGPRGASCVCR